MSLTPPKRVLLGGAALLLGWAWLAPGDRIDTALQMLPVAHAADATATVEVEGIGKDTDTALRQAWSAAVAEVVGTMVDAKTVVVNNKLIQDQILVFSKGYVEKSETLSSKVEGGMTRVRVRATVRRSDVVKKIDDLRAQKLWVDGAAMVTGATSSYDQDLKRAEMLGALLWDYKVAMNGIAVVSQHDAPVLMGDKVKLSYDVSVERDATKSAELFAELKQKLTALATGQCTYLDTYNYAGREAALEKNQLLIEDRSPREQTKGPPTCLDFGRSIVLLCSKTEYRDGKTGLCYSGRKSFQTYALKTELKDASGTVLATQTAEDVIGCSGCYKYGGDFSDGGHYGIAFTGASGCQADLNGIRGAKYCPGTESCQAPTLRVWAPTLLDTTPTRRMTFELSVQDAARVRSAEGTMLRYTYNNIEQQCAVPK